MSRAAARAHFAAIMLAVTTFGSVANKALHYFGITSYVARNPLVMGLSYICFLVLVRLWLDYAKDRAPRRRQDPHVSLDPLPKKSRRWWSWADLTWADFTEPAGWLGIALLLLAGSVFWLGAEGPGILLDAAFDFALTLGLIRAAQSDRQHWLAGVLGRTIVPFLLILAGASILLHYFDRSCPGKEHLAEVFACWAQRRRY